MVLTVAPRVLWATETGAKATWTVSQAVDALPFARSQFLSLLCPNHFPNLAASYAAYLIAIVNQSVVMWPLTSDATSQTVQN